ncbi:methylmalonyl-CoA mutase [Candidatus Marsarchaeota G2 archaeon ECH_B_SAG-F08]|jgi:methylmalonyl-CoA mutase (EC 5.4.99.2)|uniref:Methylmalonyl-CoA mutase n=4 Tax=Candidatus Marsarchaeota TaxID=1978152 RepID=A0A2R6BJ48_9ARCH|nr:MAG: methylmalonyl-CoA mutase [Candidatus Marsarchaeota G1 archaeon OSP_D]PSN88516.1 MAG: methylmalonyl-CoA mutase [Candidatus Marsarchaeota G1 archaeon OSP_C]PSN95658.1 MAG: methylmalonyl-CoA mutase [Candidatus Marsarchaeota G1 archaeon OSP_B]PSN98687.1 MAG: methylmalonyl-CoA mutase [Candidatus Marsarchaeota G2 archaeon ECH_B_SAG-F08]
MENTSTDFPKTKFTREKTLYSENIDELAKNRELSTLSGIPIKEVYMPEDLRGFDYSQKLGNPGEYPFTRGIHKTMYRTKLWTIRQFSGFGTPEETNRRFKYLLSEGETGLSVAFDMPTLMGYDPDHPMSRGEVGREGVSVASLLDMEKLFEGIPLDKVTVSMTINGPAIVLLALYIAVAEKQGVPQEALSGTIQNDILKEYIAQKEYIFPPEPSLKLVIDTFEYCSKKMPKYNFISVSGYHIREAGATAVQELAFTLADGITYVQKAIERGLDVDEFAPRISFFFDSHIDFFEEIAKFRAARRMWAKIMRERFGAKNPRSMWLRFHTQTAGVSLTAQEPYNNIVRVAYEALAAVLGGTQSLHTNAMDEALGLPTEEAAKIAVRTQQILALETGVANTVDPLAGSYFVESLTDKVEEEAWKLINEIESLGGVIKCIQSGYFQRQLSDSAYRYQRSLEEKRRFLVGVNCYRAEEPPKIPIFRIDPEIERSQVERVKKLREKRDNRAVKLSLEELKQAANQNKNLVPYVLDCVNNYATLGEVIGALKEVYGEYTEPRIF